MLEFNSTKQKLTVAEEKILVKFSLESANGGFPMKHRQIEHHANTVLELSEPIGKRWVQNFLTRRYYELQTL